MHRTAAIFLDSVYRKFEPIRDVPVRNPTKELASRIIAERVQPALAPLLEALRTRVGEVRGETSTEETWLIVGNRDPSRDERMSVDVRSRRPTCIMVGLDTLVNAGNETAALRTELDRRLGEMGFFCELERDDKRNFVIKLFFERTRVVVGAGT